LPKFPIIEYIKFEEEKLQQLLKDHFMWFTFFHFEEDIKYKLYEMGYEQDFVMFDKSYQLIIQKAMNKSIEEAQNYKRKIS